MADKSFRYFVKGIELRGESADPSDNSPGSVWHNSTSNKLKAYIESAVRELVTADQTQTLTNKTLNADNNTISNLEVDNLKSGVLNTSTTLASASDTQIPSALAVKTYIDDKAAAQNEASEITVNDTSFVQLDPAANVQAALANADAALDYQATQITNLTGDVGSGSVIGYQAITDSDPTTVNLTAANRKIRITGTIAHSIVMPDFSTLVTNTKIEIVNYSSATISVYKSDATTLITTLPPAHKNEFILTSKSPETYSFDILPVRTTAGYNFASKELLNVSTPTASTSAANKSYVDAHINDTTDAHAASAITNTPSGNLVATTVQAALDELQADVDTRLSGSQLTTHANTTSGTHGVTGTIVGTSDSQTLTNKTLTSPTINSPSITTPSRLDVKQDTRANLDTYASTASNGQLAFATNTKEYLGVVDGLMTSLGGGSSQRIAYISDTKTANTAGGASTNTFTTRTLNTIVDSTSIVTSLTSNQFVLPAGKYRVQASAPAYACNQHQIKLRNITGSSDTAIGTSEYSGSAAQTRSKIDVEFTIVSATTYEIQHRANIVAAGNGFGVAANFGTSEIYTVVQITKLV